MANPDHVNKLAAILEHISTQEFNHERPLLSVLVIRASDGEEGDGFYKMCENLGYGDWRKLKRGGEFQAKQMKRTIEFWQSDKHYFEYK